MILNLLKFSTSTRAAKRENGEEPGRPPEGETLRRNQITAPRHRLARPVVPGRAPRAPDDGRGLRGQRASPPTKGAQALDAKLRNRNNPAGENTRLGSFAHHGSPERLVERTPQNKESASKLDAIARSKQRNDKANWLADVDPRLGATDKQRKIAALRGRRSGLAAGEKRTPRRRRHGEKEARPRPGDRAQSRGCISCYGLGRGVVVFGFGDARRRTRTKHIKARIRRHALVRQVPQGRLLEDCIVCHIANRVPDWVQSPKRG